MQPNHNHIYREQQEVKRLMQTFAVKPPPSTVAKIERMLESQRQKFLELEQERTRRRSRGPGR